MTQPIDFHVPADQLVTVRNIAHQAVQWASRAARANLAPAADDSHASLAWDARHSALCSLPLDAQQRYQLGFSFASAALLWLDQGAVTATLALATVDEDKAGSWTDAQLIAAGLQATAAAQMPYVLPLQDYAALTDRGPALSTLGAWFDQADTALKALISQYAPVSVEPVRARCWPHHFDIAALFTLDPSTAADARSVGIGLSMGDASYAEPYLYCNPWPVPTQLSAAAEPLHWHTTDFTSLICPSSRMRRPEDLHTLMVNGFTALRDLLTSH